MQFNKHDDKQLQSKRKKSKTIKTWRHCLNYTLSHIFYILPLVVLVLYIAYLCMLQIDFMQILYSYQLKAKFPSLESANSKSKSTGSSKSNSAPGSLYIQNAEGITHLAPFTFGKQRNNHMDATQSIAQTTTDFVISIRCAHTAPHSSNVNMITDDNGNICSIVDMDVQTGCCQLSQNGNSFKSLVSSEDNHSSCNSCKYIESTTQTKYLSLFQQPSCCSQYHECVACCIKSFQLCVQYIIFIKIP